ncbi:hypothetical protein [Pyrodictium delaneyi]|nr:hypothetical protein [Pyrodictium delaneyi]
MEVLEHHPTLYATASAIAKPGHGGYQYPVIHLAGNVHASY